jgi:hypothetical protein
MSGLPSFEIGPVARLDPVDDVQGHDASYLFAINLAVGYARLR